MLSLSHNALAGPRKARRRRGQGMTEYIIIVCLVAIALVGIVTTYGNNLRRLFGAAVDVLSGNNGTAIKTVAAGAQGSGEKTLKNFNTGEAGM